MLPEWQAAGWDRARPLFAQDGSPLSARFDRAAARIGTLNCARSLDGFVSQSPYLAMLDALRLDYGLAGDDQRLPALGEAALAHYFYVRLLDDVIDEPEQFDRGFVYVTELFSGASQRAFAEALGDHPLFFGFKERTMAAFFAATAWDVDVVRAAPVDEADIARIGGKVLYRAVALGAVALLAGRPDHLG